MKTRSRSAGFGAVEIIIVIAVVGLLAFLGYYVYSQQNKPADTQNTQSTSPNPEQSEQPTSNEGYVEIKEWGVKIALRDYDKVQFELVNQAGSASGIELDFESYATPTFKPEFLQDDTCEPGVSVYRSEKSFTDRGQKKIGDFYYTIAGGPGACSDDPENNPDDQLQTRFLKDFTVENISGIGE